MSTLPCPHCCVWSQVIRDGAWNTGCGKRFNLSWGGPTENKMKYCHGCGEHILEKPYCESEDKVGEAKP